MGSLWRDWADATTRSDRSLLEDRALVDDVLVG